MVRLVQTATKFALSPTLASNEFAVARRAQGLKVLHMGFGESPFPVPKSLQAAIARGADRKEYLPTCGEPKLREAAAAYYAAKIGLDVSKYDAFITPGSKLGLYSLQLGIEGDLLLPCPSWVSYRPQSIMIQTQTIRIPTELTENGYRIDPAVLKATIDSARAKGQNPRKLIINYPNNPTGLTIPEDNLKELAKVCEEEDIFIISDEIYGFVSYDKNYHTISRYAPDRTAITTGLSKHLSLGGFRVGVVFVPKAVPGLFDLLSNIASETWSCISAPVSTAAIEAYNPNNKELEQHITDCTEIHNLMNTHISKELSSAGIIAPTSQGAFYNYPNLNPIREGLEAKHGVKTSEELAAFLAKEHGLIALPGTAFGEDPHTLTLRLAGCDYDGAAALDAYRAGEKLDVSFIARHAPNILEECEVFKKVAAECKH